MKFNPLYLFKYKFTKDVAWSFLAQVVSAFCGILLNIIIGNYHGAEGLGIYNQALSIYMIIHLFAVFGITRSVLKYSSENKDNPKTLKLLLSSALTIVILFSLVITLLGALLLYYFPNVSGNPPLSEALLYIFPALPFFGANKVVMAQLNGLRRMRFFAVIRTTRWILLIIFISITILLEMNLNIAMLSFLISESIIFIIFLICGELTFVLSFRDNTWYKKHFDFGSKSFLAAMISQLSGYIDVLMIGWLAGNANAGIYSLASSIAKGLMLVPAIIQENFNPIISNLWAKREVSQLSIYIKKVRKTNALLMTPIIFLVIICYPIFVNMFMNSSDYQASIPVFYFLMIGFSILSLFSWAGAMLMMGGFLIDNFKRVVIFLFLTILSNAILIPIWGIEGAAAATSFSIIISLFILRHYIKKNMGIKIF